MIEIIYKDNKLLVKGSIDFGIAGVYENKSFEDEKIQIDENLLEISEGEKNSKYYKMLKPHIENNKVNENIAKVLQDYYNEREYEIQQNTKKLKDYILLILFEDITGIKYPFWEVEEIIIKEEMQKYNKDNLEKEIYEDKREIVHSWFTKYKNVSITEIDIDIEVKLKEMFPMFNVNKFLEFIIPNELTFIGNMLWVDFSDSLDEIGVFFSCALVSFDENLIPEYLSNF